MGKAIKGRSKITTHAIKGRSKVAPHALKQKLDCTTRTKAEARLHHTH